MMYLLIYGRSEDGIIWMMAHLNALHCTALHSSAVLLAILKVGKRRRCRDE